MDNNNNNNNKSNDNDDHSNSDNNKDKDKDNGRDFTLYNMIGLDRYYLSCLGNRTGEDRTGRTNPKPSPKMEIQSLAAVDSDVYRSSMISMTLAGQLHFLLSAPRTSARGYQCD